MTKKKGKPMAKNSMDGQVENSISSTSISEDEKYLSVLSKHKHIWDLYDLTGEIVNFHVHIRGEVVEAYRHWHPHYRYNDGCSACIAEMLNIVYRFYNNKMNEYK